MKFIEYINQQLIGDNLYLTRLYSPANLPADEEGKTFDITAIKIGRTEEDVKEENLIMTLNEAVSCRDNNVKLVVTSLEITPNTSPRNIVKRKSLRNILS